MTVIQVNTRHRTIVIAGLLLVGIVSALVLAGWIHFCSFDLVDDTYISMVYAKHFAAGHGIVFYPGGERIEGYTSPLWMLFLALAAWLKLPLPGVAYLFSTIAGILVPGLVFLIYRQCFHGDEPPSFSSLFWPVAAALAVMSDAAFAAWAASGMETVVYTLLLLLLCHALQSGCSNWKVLLVLFLTAMIRPEGAAFAAVVLGYGIIQKRSWRSPLIRLILFFAIPYLILIGIRLAYFGSPFPNSFYAKHDFEGWRLVSRGVEYVYYFFRPRPFFLFALIWVLAENRGLRLRGLLVGTFALLHTLIVTVEGGDHFTLHRFLVPVIPFFSILGIRGLCLAIDQLVFQKMEGASLLCQKIAQAGVVLLVAILLSAHGAQLYEYKKDTRCGFSNGARYHRSVIEWTRNWAQVGQWLQEKYPPDTLIAVTNAGAIPFYCELRCIDMLGINDLTIGRTPLKYPQLCYPGHERSNAEYVLSRKPEMIQLFPLLFFSSKPYPETELENMITYPSQIEMWQIPEFHRDYEYKTEKTRFGFISYFERKNEDTGKTNDER